MGAIENSSIQAEKHAILASADPIAPSKRPSRARLAIALAVAAVSDFLAFWTAIATPVQWALDLGTAFVLFLILEGRRALLPGLMADAILALRVLPRGIFVLLPIHAYHGVKKFPG